MSFDPVIRLFLCSDNLAATHARSQNGNAILAGFISASLGKDRPKIGFAQVLRHTPASPIVSSKRGLRDHMTVFASL
jgi:hypothetical protein